MTFEARALLLNQKNLFLLCFLWRKIQQLLPSHFPFVLGPAPPTDLAIGDSGVTTSSIELKWSSGDADEYEFFFGRGKDCIRSDRHYIHCYAHRHGQKLSSYRRNYLYLHTGWKNESKFWLLWCYCWATVNSMYYSPNTSHAHLY